MLDLQWDSFSTSKHPPGELPEWAVSTVGSTKVELSMRDERIWRELPREQWLGVMLAPQNNVKMGRIHGAWVTLFGFGRPNDPAGNLMFIRVRSDLETLTTQPGSPDAQQFARATKAIFMTMQGLGISPDSSMLDYMRGN